MEEICSAIENDRPNEAIAKTREKLDLTGTYRFLAYLCVPEKDWDENIVKRDYCK